MHSYREVHMLFFFFLKKVRGHTDYMLKFGTWNVLYSALLHRALVVLVLTWNAGYCLLLLPR